ncbi:hypothetical protein GY45DRAFT_1366335 [Cubamyces sp. BRFM 1775]|nr:hypothetical protein GY45DRAFT_1366335 [Cubamyces sp. BRFM 1775]
MDASPPTAFPPAAIATPAGQGLRNTYGALLVSTIIAAALYGASVLQALYYYDRFPEDHWAIKLTVAVVWALDTTTTVLNAHAIYYYLIANFNNPPALLTQVWSVQVEMLVTFTAVLIVQLFFIQRIFKLRPYRWYIPLCQVIVAVASYSLVIVIEARINTEVLPSSLGLCGDTSEGIEQNPLIANWATGLVVDVSITVILCWYLWSEKSYVRKRTHRMINRIIVFSVNRGAFAAGTQLFAFVTKFMAPNNLIWLSFHNVLCKIYTNSMLATLNSRIVLRGMMSDTEQATTEVDLPAIRPSQFGAKPEQRRAPGHQETICSIQFALGQTSQTDPRSFVADGDSEQSGSSDNVNKVATASAKQASRLLS